MAFQLDFGIWGNIFAVPAAIVDEHIQLCGASSLKALLVLLRHNQRQMEISDISKIVGLSDSDTQDAMNYWIASGVIRIVQRGGMDVIEPARGASPEKATAAPVQAPPPPAEPPAGIPEQGREQEQEQKVVRLTSRPRLTPETIARMSESDNKIKSLIQEAQGLLGKPLSPSATEILISLYSYGGMSIELILMVIQYCVSIDKANARYIETTAYDWIDRGIDTFDKAEQHILKLTRASENEKKICVAFGIYNRSLTTKEMDYVNKWLDHYKFDIPMIKLAFERAVDAKGKISFAYCDGILSKWNEKGIRTPRQAVDEMNTPPRQEHAAPRGGTGQGPSAPQTGDRGRYDRAHALLQQRRNDARDTAVKRKEEVYAALPRVKEIDASLAKTGFEVSRAVLMGGDTSSLLAELREKNLRLQQEKEQELIHGGYPADYLETPYHCRICEDKGYKPSGEACDCLKTLLNA